MKTMFCVGLEDGGAQAVLRDVVPLVAPGWRALSRLYRKNAPFPDDLASADALLIISRWDPDGLYAFPAEVYDDIAKQVHRTDVPRLHLDYDLILSEGEYLVKGALTILEVPLADPEARAYHSTQSS